MNADTYIDVLDIMVKLWTNGGILAEAVRVLAEHCSVCHGPWDLEMVRQEFS